MISTPASVRVFVCTTPTDMRRSFDGLSGMVRDLIKADPCCGHLFVFRNKRGHLAKVLWWDRSGFSLFYKRLEKGVFRFPTGSDASLEIDAAELTLLLEGIDLAGAKRRARFEPPPSPRSR